MVWQSIGCRPRARSLAFLWRPRPRPILRVLGLLGDPESFLASTPRASGTSWSASSRCLGSRSSATPSVRAAQEGRLIVHQRLRGLRAGEVRDLVLAERLSLFSPLDFTDIEAFREHLLTTLDDHLSQLSFAPRVVFGRPFYFVVGHLASVPLGVEAWTLQEFRDGLSRVDEECSIYYHAVEGIERTPDPRNDLSRWVEDALGLPTSPRGSPASTCSSSACRPSARRCCTTLIGPWSVRRERSPLLPTMRAWPRRGASSPAPPGRRARRPHVHPRELHQGRWGGRDPEPDNPHGGARIRTRWEVIEGTPAYYEVTKQIHNTLQGARMRISDEMWDIYLETRAGPRRPWTSRPTWS